MGNIHNYSFGEMLDNINNMMRLQIMQANPNGPKFATGHKKQENIWHKQYTREISRANLTNYPEAGKEITEWKEGKVEARQKAKEMGMTPNFFLSDQIENETSNDQEWFFKPFGCLETNAEEDMALDEDIHEKELEESEELEETIPESTVLQSLPYLENDQNDAASQAPQAAYLSYVVSSTSWNSVRLLNEDPKLSNARSVRDKQLERAEVVKENLLVSQVVKNLDYSMMWFIRKVTLCVGKICRIRKKGASRGYLEYKMPVKFDSNLKDIPIVVAEYTCIDMVMLIYLPR